MPAAAAHAFFTNRTDTAARLTGWAQCRDTCMHVHDVACCVALALHPECQHAAAHTIQQASQGTFTFRLCN